jgi:hypothetical protein
MLMVFSRLGNSILKKLSWRIEESNPCHQSTKTKAFFTEMCGYDECLGALIGCWLWVYRDCAVLVEGICCKKLKKNHYPFSIHGCLCVQLNDLAEGLALPQLTSLLSKSATMMLPSPSTTTHNGPLNCTAVPAPSANLTLPDQRECSQCRLERSCTRDDCLVHKIIRLVISSTPASIAMLLFLLWMEVTVHFFFATRVWGLDATRPEATRNFFRYKK